MTKRRQRDDSLASGREFGQFGGPYAAEHEGRWPSDLATCLREGMPARLLRYRYSETPELPDGATLTNAEIDAHSDFAYFGGDLVDSPAMRAESSRIIVLYGKRVLPEIPRVVYDADRKVYEYPYAARPVAFADGQARCVSVDDLPKLIFDHNAARLRLGLPAQQIAP